jgi:hypothetical protein
VLIKKWKKRAAGLHNSAGFQHQCERNIAAAKYIKDRRFSTPPPYTSPPPTMIQELMAKGFKTDPGLIKRHKFIDFVKHAMRGRPKV